VDPIRTAIVSDDPIARRGLAALLGDRADLLLTAEAGPGDAEGLAAGAADVILWDVAGTAAQRLGEVAAGTPVVALVATEEQAAEALTDGARAVIFRGAGADRIAAALVAGARGLLVLEADLSRWVRPPGRTASAEGLTPREVEVLALLGEGLANKTIAQRLGIAERTAKFHVESILGKLGAESRSEAIVLAARRGLLVL
jgi:two-component system, NarL family, nitrate/nitrite response regulator NarL